jgi:hypothetical protein
MEVSFFDFYKENIIKEKKIVNLRRQVDNFFCRNMKNGGRSYPGVNRKFKAAFFVEILKLLFLTFARENHK